MATLRYAAQEAANISKAAEATKQTVALDGYRQSTAAASALSSGLAGKMGTWVAVPASAAASGTAGQLAYASGQLYICVATNTWQRVAIATW